MKSVCVLKNELEILARNNTIYMARKYVGAGFSPKINLFVSEYFIHLFNCVFKKITCVHFKDNCKLIFSQKTMFLLLNMSSQKRVFVLLSYMDHCPNNTGQSVPTLEMLQNM